ncbi:CHAT domain-containing protein [Nannocystis sp.]|uniref:CHAT domain-containing protein n=1 Tax=Nannocystis sp. TaxID=1962667 RepID=UPI0025ED635C|nr:CHAT domain-containing protein [Nannocystis sp.]MBK7828412.1 CHAT domain-containing protein [Nannocystis sp.]
MDLAELRAAELNPERYGRLLADALFSAPAIAALISEVRTAAIAASLPLELRLKIPADATELHALRWERLWTNDEGPLAASERVLLTRCVDCPSGSPLDPRPKNGMRALVVVAAPTDLADYPLAQIDATWWARQAREQLGSISTVLLAARGQATLANIGERLADADILYVVCHGTINRQGAHLWLEQEDGQCDTVPAERFVERIKAASRLPRLVVLVSCHSAGAGDPDTFASAVGPALARAGVPAVIAMQARLSLATATALMPPLFRALTRHGRVDRALAAARAGVLALHRPDWWVPTLFMRDKFAGLWAPAPSTRSMRTRR